MHTDLVAFLDSDCVPPPGWIDALAGHFGGPRCPRPSRRASSPPRVLRAGPGARSISAPRPGRVAPGTPVSYVPTAALLARRSALLEVAIKTTDVIRSGESAVDDIRCVFDPALRYGEDVDLVWRLHQAGWRLRYEPSVRVDHVEPATWPGLLARRFRYGSSAAGLTQRHPGAMAPLILEPWAAAGLAALLARRPGIAALAFAGAVADETRVRKAAGIEVGAAGAVARPHREDRPGHERLRHPVPRPGACWPA